MTKVRVRFIELGDKLRLLLDEEYDLTTGSGLPMPGDCVHIYDKGAKPERMRQFWVVERHWNFGNVVGMLEIYLSSTSEGARRI
jgi:hypothetical protein